MFSFLSSRRQISWVYTLAAAFWTLGIASIVLPFLLRLEDWWAAFLVGGFFSLVVGMICAVFARQGDRDVNEYYAARKKEREELRRAVSVLFVSIINALDKSEELRQLLGGLEQPDIDQANEPLGFNDFLSKRSVIGRPSVDNQVAWAGATSSRLDVYTTLLWHRGHKRNELLFEVICTLLGLARDLEESRDQELRETRSVCRTVRQRAVQQLLRCFEFIPEGVSPQVHLLDHSSPASLRDVVEKQMEKIMEGDRPWRDTLLKFVFAKQEEETEPGEAPIS